MNKIISTLAIASLLAIPATVSAVTATTDPIGGMTISVPAASDIAVGVPFQRTAVFQGTVSSASGTTITVSGTPFTSGEFNSSTETYYALIGSGTKEGLYATITDNTTSALTVTLPTGESLSSISNGDTVKVIPMWTLSSLFDTVSNGTKILVFEPTGQNVSATAIYTYNNGWKNGFANADNIAIHPYESFVIRNEGGSQVDLTVSGAVPMSKHRHVITSNSSNKIDNRVLFTSPVAETVADAFPNPTNGDQLLIFDNSTTGLNKSASKLLTYNSGTWRNGFADASSEVINPGAGLVYRRSANASHLVWDADQTYNP